MRSRRGTGRRKEGEARMRGVEKKRRRAVS